MLMYRKIRHRRLTSVTNYKKRVEALKSGMKRVTVRKSNREISMQIIQYEVNGDKVLASCNSKELKPLGWEPRCNIPTAYLTGLLLGKKLNDNNSEYILDIGLYRRDKGIGDICGCKGICRFRGKATQQHRV